MYKNYEEGVLYLSNNDQEKWKDYAFEHGLDVKKYVQSDRPWTTVNWLRPFFNLTQNDYKVFDGNLLQK